MLCKQLGVRVRLFWMYLWIIWLRCGQISDNGVGIPKEHLSHIFDPFYTTRTGGTGLGLANVEKIVLAHGGRISVISEIDIGSCFIISFPIGRR